MTSRDQVNWCITYLFMECFNGGLDETGVAFIRDYSYDFTNNDVSLDMCLLYPLYLKCYFLCKRGNMQIEARHLKVKYLYEFFY